MDLTIRMETPLEWEIVEKVVQESFQTAEHTDHKEHHLVHRLRESAAFLPPLSLVAEKQGWIVGHVLFTKVQVGGKILLALAPVSVLPEEQNQGIGSRLIQEGYKRAAALGYPGVIVLGHAAYYPRFGYRPAAEYGINAPFPVPDHCFLVKELQENGLSQVQGTVEYAKEFFEEL